MGDFFCNVVFTSRGFGTQTREADQRSGPCKVDRRNNATGYSAELMTPTTERGGISAGEPFSLLVAEVQKGFTRPVTKDRGGLNEMIFRMLCGWCVRPKCTGKSSNAA